VSTKELCGFPVMDRKAGVMSECGRPKGHPPRANGYPNHVCIAAVQRNAEQTAKRNVERLSSESVCCMKGCDNTAPKGAMLCRECHHVANSTYRATPAGKAAQVVWQATYHAKPEVKSRQAARDSTPERKAYYAAYRATPEGKAAGHERNRNRRQRLANANYENLTDLEIFERENGACYICGTAITLDTMHVEHVVPIAKFADYASECDGEFVSGLRASCAACNLSKSDKGPAAYALERWKSGLPIVQVATVNCAEVCPLFALAA